MSSDSDSDDEKYYEMKKKNGLPPCTKNVHHLFRSIKHSGEIL
jgi:hypothetical protein